MGRLHLIDEESKKLSSKVVYGTDDRLDLEDVTNSTYLTLAKSTAAMMPPSNLTTSTLEGYYQINAKTLSDQRICSTERFADQTMAANCSGFLVGKDILVTAGHCMQRQSDCDGSYWVFDYYNNNGMIPKTSVYSCKEIISQSLDSSSQNDYAIIRLDRLVTDRLPLTYRKSGKIGLGDPLVIIGNPSGLPTKVADNAYVRTNDKDIFFQANLDSFGGNSGSAVFNADTGDVEGILVRGAQDYKYDYSRYCYVVNTYSMTNGRGEDVTRITNISDILDQHVGSSLDDEDDDFVDPFQPGKFTWDQNSNLAIPDYSSVIYTINVDADFQTVDKLTVTLDITHTWSGDLGIVLVSPSGTEVILRSREGGSSDDVHETYELDKFNGTSALGEWKLLLIDNARHDIGTMDSIKFELVGH